MESWQPLQVTFGSAAALHVVFAGFGVAASIYHARQQRIRESILDVVAGVCLGFTISQALEFESVTQATQWSVVTGAMVVVFSLLYFFIRPRPTREEVAAAKTRLRTKVLHERLHQGAGAVRYLECEFCRDEVNG